MIQFLLMLLGLAWGNHTGNTTGHSNTNSGGIPIQNTVPEPGKGGDDGTGEPHGPIGGNTGQTPP